MQEVPSYSWPRLSGGITNGALMTPASGKRLVVTYVNVTVSADTTANPSCRIGFAATTLPAPTTDSLTALPGMFFEHAAITKGGGAVGSNGGAIIGIGEIDEPIRITCAATPGGFLGVVMNVTEIDPNV